MTLLLPGERVALSWQRSVAPFAVLFGAEIALARFTTGPLAWGDIALSAAAFVLLSVAAIALRSRPIAAARLAAAPAAVLALGIALPVAARAGSLATAVPVGCLSAWLLSRCVSRARRGVEFGLPISPALLLLATAALSAWWAGPAGLPPAGVLLPIAASWVALALLARRTGGVILVAAFAVALARLPASYAAPSWSAQAPERDAPDIVLITVDALRADTALQMQSLRKIAKDGGSFPAVQAPAPWTLPSMATLLTGAAIERHGALRTHAGGFAPIRADVQTVAERLSQLGYDTAAVVGPNPFLTGRFGFDRGFAVFEHASEANEFALPRISDGHGYGGGRPIAADLLAYVGLLGRPLFWSADELAARAGRILEQRRERPLFLWVHFFDCHLPYRHADETDLSGPIRRALDGGAGRSEIVRNGFWQTPEGRVVLLGAYQHEAGRVDGAILDLLVALESSARGPQRPIVALTSDHGEEFFEHGGFEHGHSLYQEVVGVPLAISGLVFDTDVQLATAGLADVAATLLAAAGDTNTGTDGHDLAGPFEPRAYATGNLLYGDAAHDRYAVRGGDWKTISGPGGTEFYDLESDPGETNDMATAHPRLALHIASSVKRADRPASGTELHAAVLDERASRALQALGYLED